MEKISILLSRKFYYGWVIVGLSMISMSFWFGIRTTFSLFFVVFVDSFHWGRAEVAGVQSTSMIVYMIMAPVIGNLIDRMGPRWVILPGILLTVSGLLLCTQIQTLLQFYLFFGVIVGIGITCLSIAPFTILLAHWFERKRGTANGLAAVGIGIGIFVFVPMIQYFISFWGWQTAFFVLSLFFLLIPLPLNALFLKRSPQEMGLLPDGDSPGGSLELDPKKIRLGESFGSTISQKEWPLKEIGKTRRFWFLVLFPSFSTFGVYIIIVHHVKYLVDLGIDKIWAASLFAGTGALSGFFRFFWGWLSDRVGREITFTLGGICFSSGILLLLLFQYFPDQVILYLFALLFGAGWGVTAPMFMSISGDLYKGKHFGSIYGILEGMIGIGAAAGSWVAGYIFDQTQEYFWAFILAILFSLISILLVWFVAPRKFRSKESLENAGVGKDGS